MKKRTLMAASILAFVVNAAFATTDISTNIVSQDSLGEILLPEDFSVELENMVKASRPKLEESTNQKSKDPMLAKSTGWAEFFYVNDNQTGWQELNSAQLFYSNGQEIIGYVYGNGSNPTPFGPSCYITESDYNMQVDEFTGWAFRCASGEVFFFFSHKGNKYLAIYYNNRTRVYSN